MGSLLWVVVLVSVLTLVDGSPTLHKDKPKKACSIININKVSNKRKCYGLPDRNVCSERYKQVCENVVRKDTRVACTTQIVSDQDEEICETELINECHTTYTTVYEDKCTTVNKVQCYGGYGGYGGGGGAAPAPVQPGNGGEEDSGNGGGGKKKGKKGKKGRKKRGVLQAILLNNALNQRHPTRAPATEAPAAAAPVAQPQCYNVPTTTCKKVGKEVPETHCQEVEGETLCTRIPKAREVQTCKNIEFGIPQVSCRHVPWQYCENAPNEECHSVRVINKGVGHRTVC